MANYNTRDGFMAVNGSGGSAPNYEPNSQSDTPIENPVYA